MTSPDTSNKTSSANDSSTTYSASSQNTAASDYAVPLVMSSSPYGSTVPGLDKVTLAMIIVGACAPVVFIILVVAVLRCLRQRRRHGNQAISSNLFRRQGRGRRLDVTYATDGGVTKADEHGAANSSSAWNENEKAGPSDGVDETRDFSVLTESAVRDFFDVRFPEDATENMKNVSIHSGSIGETKTSTLDRQANPGNDGDRSYIVKVSARHNSEVDSEHASKITSQPKCSDAVIERSNERFGELSVSLSSKQPTLPMNDLAVNDGGQRRRTSLPMTIRGRLGSAGFVDTLEASDSRRSDVSCRRRLSESDQSDFYSSGSDCSNSVKNSEQSLDPAFRSRITSGGLSGLHRSEACYDIANLATIPSPEKEHTLTISTEEASVLRPNGLMQLAAETASSTAAAAALARLSSSSSTDHLLVDHNGLDEVERVLQCFDEMVDDYDAESSSKFNNVIDVVSGDARGRQSY